MGIGELDCEKPELLHELSDSWMSMWYLYYPGSYTVCHRPAPSAEDPRPEWREQVKVHLLEPTPEHCSYMRNASSSSGFVRCELNPNNTIRVFDGFVNNGTIPQSHRCTFDGNECDSLGGTCVCYGKKCSA